MDNNQTPISVFELDEESLHAPREPCSIEPLLFALVFIGGGVSWYILNKFLK